MLKNASTLAIRNVHTAGNEPCEVGPHSVDRCPRYLDPVLEEQRPVCMKEINLPKAAQTHEVLS